MVARQLLDLGEFAEGLRRSARRPRPLLFPRASTRTSTPAGSRCASSTMRRRPRAVSPRRARSPRRRCRSPAPPIGRGAPPRRWTKATKRGASTSAPRAEPIAYYGQLAGQAPGPQRDRLARAGEGRERRRARRGDARRRIALRRRARRSRDLARRGGGRALARRGAGRRARRGGGGPRRRDDQRRIRQDRDRTRLRARRGGVPDFRRAVLRAAAEFGGPGERLRRGAAGERIRLARGLRRRRQGPDADPALDRAVDRAARRRALRRQRA